MGRRRQIAGSRLLITGASQGIGKALADLAARRGARVIAAARSLELLEELSATVRGRGDQLEIVQADITRADDRQRMLEAAPRRDYRGRSAEEITPLSLPLSD